MSDSAASLPRYAGPASGRSKINVLIVGGGGREHAIAAKVAASPRLGTLYIGNPENPGLAALGTPVDVPVSTREAYRLQQFCEKKNVGLVIIGPEDPLAEGMADKLRSAKTMVFGPSMEAARLEGDKGWAKQLMRGASIPTAEARVFSDPEGARSYLESRVPEDEVLAGLFEEAARFRDSSDRRKFIQQAAEKDKAVFAAYSKPRSGLPVIKAAGLAKGKGVIVPGSLLEAVRAIERIMVKGEFGDAGKRVVIEERLTGPEVSVLAIVDGRGGNIMVLPPCQDHKRLKDGDEGPNTGGMGAFCPAGTLDGAMMEKVEREVLVPAVDAMRREGIEYVGVLYAGLMLTPAGPKVLEFNCRFGDPECQPLMARLKTDPIDLFEAACTGRLDEIEIEWDERAACCIVIASEGYPEKPRTGIVIEGIEDANAVEGVMVYHAGTKLNNEGKVVTAGGRVLGVTALGATMEEARERAYEACGKIAFAGMQFRRDIAVGAGGEGGGDAAAKSGAKPGAGVQPGGGAKRGAGAGSR